MVRYILPLVITNFLCFKVALSQNSMDLSYTYAPKEKIISQTPFKKPEEAAGAEVIRFDHVGQAGDGSYSSLLLSSSEISDYFNISNSDPYIHVRLDTTLMNKISSIIKECNTNMNLASQRTSHGQFRITYRIKGEVGQYFTVNRESSVKILKKIEKALNGENYGVEILPNEDGILKRYYEFLESSRLVNYIDSKYVWLY
jgi:hypothetical protein